MAAVLLTGDTVQPPVHTHPINDYGGNTCNQSVAECFGNGDSVKIKDFSAYGPNNPLPKKDFDAFSNVLAKDIYSHEIDSPGFFSGRDAYDTPFYNGGGRRSPYPDGIYPSNQQVCIEGLRCSGRSDINYIAQGMWAAKTGEPPSFTQSIITAWKLQYILTGNTVNTGNAIWWSNYGSYYYKKWLEEQQQQQQQQQQSEQQP